MKIGLDFYGTIDKAPELYRRLADEVIGYGGEVHIVTAVAAHNERAVRKAIQRSRVAYTEIHIIVFTDYFSAPRLKAQKCQELGLLFLVDDRADTCEALRVRGMLGFLV